jgi:hypothetical protein
MVRGRHSRAYYREADQWLKNEVAAFRLEETDPVVSAEKRAFGILARQRMQELTSELEV